MEEGFIKKIVKVDSKKEKPSGEKNYIDMILSSFQWRYGITVYDSVRKHQVQYTQVRVRYYYKNGINLRPYPMVATTGRLLVLCWV